MMIALRHRPQTGAFSNHVPLDPLSGIASVEPPQCRKVLNLCPGTRGDDSDEAKRP